MRGRGAGQLGGAVGGIELLFASVLQLLVLYATGDAIFLALAIEENMHEMAYYLKGGDTVRRWTRAEGFEAE